ncbi:MAG: ATP-dependent protease subunit HslV [Deltaproteobacteria bacterium]|jgi:ATP-dependent HslUV protease subunit HslV|nr:ATP-dependent protease subunit HslV [Deltaproteobacteria bacterium]
MLPQFQGTTIIAVRHNGQVAVCGDGQVSLQNVVLKTKARKVRRLYQDKIICGVAGSTADAFSIMEHFEKRLTEYSGNLIRAAVELAKSWRTDKILRRLEAMMVTCDAKHMFLISGNGDVVEPDDNLLAIGSGGFYALAAAKAMIKHSQDLSAGEIASEALKIAAGICLYTNDNLTLETLEAVNP